MATFSDHQQRMLDQGRPIEQVRQHRPRVTVMQRYIIVARHPANGHGPLYLFGHGETTWRRELATVYTEAELLLTLTPLQVDNPTWGFEAEAAPTAEVKRILGEAR